MRSIRRLLSAAHVSMAAPVAAAVLGAILALPGPPPARAEHGFQVESEVRYEVRPEAGAVHVRMAVHLANDGSGAGHDYHPGPLDHFDLWAAGDIANASAVDAAGRQLPVQGEAYDRRVRFPRPLAWGESYEFTLEYDLVNGPSRAAIITEGYVAFRAMAVGDASTVEIVLPGAPYQAQVDDPDCEEQSDTLYRCVPAEPQRFRPFVEAARPDARQTLSGTVSTGGGEVEVRISYFAGDEEWAAHVLALVQEAFPVMEELHGFPFTRGDLVTIRETPAMDLGWAAGRASLYCGETCNIWLHPGSRWDTVLHEVAHLWSHIYEKRWLIEGLAERMAGNAGVRLGLAEEWEIAVWLPGVSPADFPLDDWGMPTWNPDEEEQERELTGYVTATDFLALVEARLGLEAVQATNRALADDDGPADSRRFMDALEEASGQVLDRLFLEWVFPPAEAPVLHERRTARDAYGRLRAAAAQQGLGEPEAIRDAIDRWEFRRAVDLMADAAPALLRHQRARAYLEAHGLAEGDRFRRLWETGRPEEALAFARDQERAARAIVAAERADGGGGLWAAIGLIGTDADGTLETARTTLGADDPILAERLAGDAVEVYEHATEAGQRRVVMTLLMTGVLAAAISGPAVWRRWGRNGGRTRRW